MVKEIIIISENILNIPLNNIKEIIDIKLISNNINLYKINENFENIIINLDDIKENLNLQLKHTQWNQLIKVNYKNIENNIDYFYLNFYNSFTKKKYYFNNLNFLITNYDINYKQGFNQYINNKFVVLFSKEEYNIFEKIQNNNKNYKYYINNYKKIEKIMNPFYSEYIKLLSNSNEKLKIYYIK